MSVDPIDQALAYYLVDCNTVFKKVEDDVLRKIANEISAFSSTTPMHLKHSQKELKSAFRYFEDACPSAAHLKQAEDGIQIVDDGGNTLKEKTSTLYLMALLTYAVNRLTKGGLEDKGIAYLEQAKVLMK